MSFSVNLSTTASSTVIDALNKLMLTPVRKKQMLNEIGLAMSQSTTLRFTEQKTPSGTPWRPSWRAKTQGGQTLRDTGRLANSFTHNAQGDSVAWGTNVAFAHVLHFGATIRPVTGDYLSFRTPTGGFARVKQVVIPPRPFLGMSTADDRTVLSIITSFMGGA